MTPNLPEEPRIEVQVLPDRTAKSGASPTNALHVEQLALDQQSRKRPAGSDVHPQSASGRADSPAKVTRKSSGNLRSSPDTFGRSPRSTGIVRRLSERSRRLDSTPRRVTSPQKSFSKHHEATQGVNPYYSRSPADPISPAKPGNGLGSTSKSNHIANRRPTGAQRTTEDAIADHEARQISKHGGGEDRPRSKSEDRLSFEDGEFKPNLGLLSQPESRPISEQQLAAEVKGIYSGLVIVETKCINVINAQTVAMRDAEARGEAAAYSRHVEYFQALIALHRTLLQEQHDFFLASQHPTATLGIRNLASRYSMPARMWKHGIHNFLELLRKRLPASLEYMLAFIYLAFQMMALLVETVPSFEETWIECLGDLARYRMAIEEVDIRDRETWTGVARRWYLKAVDKNANIGRLYHHLAILARSHPLQQVSLYGRSLVANQPFPSTRDSIMTLFTPTMARYKENPTRVTSLETLYTIIHAAIYTRQMPEDLEKLLLKFLMQLNDYITHMGLRWKDGGACMAIANIAAVLKFGAEQSHSCKLFRGSEDISEKPPQPSANSDKGNSTCHCSIRMLLKSCPDVQFPDPDTDPSEVDDKSMSFEWRLLTGTLDVALQRLTDNNVLPHIHCMLLFYWRLASSSGSAYVSRYLSFPTLVTFLNTLVSSVRPGDEICDENFIMPPEHVRQPLSEDFAIRGQIWSNQYFSSEWFDTASSDFDERFMEHDKKIHHLRSQRILWLAVRLASLGPPVKDGENQKQKSAWLFFNRDTKYFSTTDDAGL